MVASGRSVGVISRWWERVWEDRFMYTPGEDYSRARFVLMNQDYEGLLSAARCLAPLASKAGSWFVFCSCLFGQV